MSWDGNFGAGLLRWSVSIQSYTSAWDHGNETRTDTTLANVNAGLFWSSGSERMASGEVSAETQLEVLIRYRTDVRANMRVLVGARTFEIVAPPVQDEERHRWTLLKCKEINPA